MSAGRTQVDPAAVLADFCAALKRLHEEAGGPSVLTLGRDRQVPLQRTQIYATLAGSISAPPTWEFVDVFVQRCRAFAAQRRVRLSVLTAGRDWHADHRFLVTLWKWRNHAGPVPVAPAQQGRTPGRVLTVQEITTCLVPGPDGVPPGRIGVVTGSLRQIRCANVWVNSENTEMRMARVEEFSISAVIRYEGARHDASKRVVDDLIANELEAQVVGLRPVAAGTVIVTGAGELTRRNGVQYIVHVAAVHGEPGRGYQPTRDLARCVDNVLLKAEELAMPEGEPVTVLVPLLGTGNGGAAIAPTAAVLIHTATNYLRAACPTRIAAVLFQAYTDLDLDACRNAMASAGLTPP
jgi:hypothetical protein